MNNKGALVSGIAKSAMARQQAGFTVEQMIQLPSLTVETLVELITRRLEQPEPPAPVGSSLPQVLQTTLEACCTKFNEPSQTVLFRRGESAFGMFLVLKGKVSLDFGVDGPNLLNTTLRSRCAGRFACSPHRTRLQHDGYRYRGRRSGIYFEENLAGLVALTT